MAMKFQSLTTRAKTLSPSEEKGKYLNQIELLSDDIKRTTQDVVDELKGKNENAFISAMPVPFDDNPTKIAIADVIAD